MPSPTTSGSYFLYTQGLSSTSVNALASGLAWGTALGGGATITYSFPGAVSYWDPYYSSESGSQEPNNYFALTATQQPGFQNALQQWANVANITFVQSADTEETVGDIRVAYSYNLAPGAYAWAYFPGGSVGGDVWLNASYASLVNSGFTPGSYEFMTLTHELGHALGMMHSFGHAYALASGSDSNLSTVMSYTSVAGQSPSSLSFYPTTLMAVDIAAAQYVYGPNMSYHAGNDNYVFTEGQNYLQTIWDAGGVDAITYNSTSNGAVIDLVPGHWSNLGNDITGYYSSTSVQIGSNVNIYSTVVIENATGGNGADTLIGNSVANVLTGNGGADTLDGGLGNDTLAGGAGNDTLTGGTGDDTAVLSGISADYVFQLLSPTSVRVTHTASGEADALNTVEFVRFGDATTMTLASLTGGGDSDDFFNGTAAADGFDGAGGNDVINGAGGNDTLTGGTGNDTLNGGLGIDTLTGGPGNDTYVVDNAGDLVVEIATEGTDTVRTTASRTLDANAENLVLLGVANLNGTGNGADNLITGNNGVNQLDGGAGNDVMTGGLGGDSYVVDSATDQTIELAGGGVDLVKTALASHTLAGNVENLLYTGSGSFSGTGNALVNVLTGGAGNDLLDGGLGADVMIGGLGNDSFVIENSADRVVEAVSGGIDTLLTARAALNMNAIHPVTLLPLYAQVENLTYTGAENFAGVGSPLANRMTGGTGNDTLNGGLGIDTLTGGAGNDTYVVDNAGDLVVEIATEGTDTVRTTASRTLDANAENLVLLGVANLNGTGNGADNLITGNNGINQLDGGAGDDVMTGGLGSDTYFVDSAQDQVIEFAVAGGGVDVVKTTLASYSPGSNVEQVVYTGSGNFAGTGNALANTLTGGAGNDNLDGGLGADTLIGGAGNDTFVIENALDRVVELVGGGTDTIQTARASLSLVAVNPTALAPLYANVDNLTYTGAGNFVGVGNTLANVLTGGAGNDSLNGGLGNDTLLGNAGNDTLNGGVGNDTLEGGAGNDIYVVNNAADVVTENANAGTDTIQASASYTIAANVESLVLIGVGNVNAFGDARNNLLTGNAGINQLDGGAGDDVMTGGLGSDTYFVDSAQDQVIEFAVAGGGVDVVKTTLASYSPGSNVEQVVYTGSGNFAGTGNALANTLTGGAGNDNLDGGLGADTLIGGAGNDTFVIENALDRVVELVGGGTDTIQTARASLSLVAVNPTALAPLYANVDNLTYTGAGNFVGVGNTLANVLTGGAGNDSLNGGLGNDTLLGNAGNDTLNGGVGNDTLEGGAGSDMFVFNAAKSAANADTITDFVSSEDVLCFENAIFTTLGANGTLVAAAFVEGIEALDASDRLIYDSSSGALYYDADGTGAIAAVQVASLNGNPALLFSDIQVI